MSRWPTDWVNKLREQPVKHERRARRPDPMERPGSSTSGVGLELALMEVDRQG